MPLYIVAKKKHRTTEWVAAGRFSWQKNQASEKSMPRARETAQPSHTIIIGGSAIQGQERVAATSRVRRNPAKFCLFE
ncbi:MAG: hypothetical protein ABFS09_03935 [Thermodesulfobacteriota bacterium]